MNQRHVQSLRYVFFDGHNVCNPYDRDPPSSGGDMTAVPDGPCRKAALIVQRMYKLLGGDMANKGEGGLPAGRELHLSFHPGRSIGSARAYAKTIARLWKVYPFNKVKVFAPVNEPNLVGMPAKTAAAIWRRTRQEARRGGSGNPACKGCRIVAGEFAAYKLSGFDGSYVDQYMDELDKPGMAKPKYWALHDYYDLFRSDGSGRPLRNFPYAKHFSRQVRSRYGDRRRVLLSEQGVLLSSRAQGRTFVDGSPDRQRYYAQRYTKLRGVDRNIVLTAYFTFFGQVGFDSALVEPPDTVNPLRGDTSSAPEYYRAVYCVLAKRPASSCTALGNGAPPT